MSVARAALRQVGSGPGDPLTTNLTLRADEMPERLNLHGTGSIIVVAYFDLVEGRYENQKDYELTVNDNGVVALIPCVLAERCGTGIQ